MIEVDYISHKELEKQLDYILSSPSNRGILKKIVRRPEIEKREEIEEGEISFEDGLKGDCWKTRGSSKTEDGSAHPEMQLNLMNARVIEVVAQTQENWKWAGDQLFVDLDLSEKNLPPGTRLQIGPCEIEITSIPHNGCGKFRDRFGSDALKFVNSQLGKKHHFRGVNAKVIKEGIIKKGDQLIKLT